MLAITEGQLRDWLKLQGRFDDCQKDNKELTGQIATQDHQLQLSAKDVDLANLSRDSALKDLARSQEDARRNLGLAMSEQALRQQLVAALPVKAKTGGFAGKVLDFLNSPAGEIGFRLVVPTVTAIKTWRQ